MARMTWAALTGGKKNGLAYKYVRKADMSVQKGSRADTLTDRQTDVDGRADRQSDKQTHKQSEHCQTQGQTKNADRQIS